MSNERVSLLFLTDEELTLLSELICNADGELSDIYGDLLLKVSVLQSQTTWKDAFDTQDPS